MNALDEILKETRETIAQLRGWTDVSHVSEILEAVVPGTEDHIGYIVITKTCMECGKRGEFSLTDEEAEALLKGFHPYRAMPNRTADVWEQVHTGYHPACWNAAFPEEE